MFEFLSIRNFKSLKDVTWQAVRLNVLMGLNSSGKSSFLQALLMLRTAVEREHGIYCINLNHEDLNIGTALDFFYCYGADEKQTCRIDLKPEKSDASVSLELYAEHPDDDRILLRDTSVPRSDTDSPSSLVQLFKTWAGIQYISAGRFGPRQQHLFSQSSIASKQWGVNGEFSVAYLAENGDTLQVSSQMLYPGTEEDCSLSGQVNAWLSAIAPGTKVNAEKRTALSRAILSVNPSKGLGKQTFRPQNVGFGISYTLPLVIMLLSARPGDCLLLENPEAHIHPRGQSAFGKLIAGCAQSGVQIFAETHSDHIVNGIRVAVRQKIIDRKQVAIAFFNRKEKSNPDSGILEQYSEISNIKIDSQGELSDYPPGFLDEWTTQLLELV